MVSMFSCLHDATHRREKFAAFFSSSTLQDAIVVGRWSQGRMKAFVNGLSVSQQRKVLLVFTHEIFRCPPGASAEARSQSAGRSGQIKAAINRAFQPIPRTLEHTVARTSESITADSDGEDSAHPDLPPQPPPHSPRRPTSSLPSPISARPHSSTRVF